MAAPLANHMNEPIAAVRAIATPRDGPFSALPTYDRPLLTLPLCAAADWLELVEPLEAEFSSQANAGAATARINAAAAIKRTMISLLRSTSVRNYRAENAVSASLRGRTPGA